MVHLMLEESQVHGRDTSRLSVNYVHWHMASILKKKEMFRKRGLQISVIGLIISFGAYWLYFFLKF